MDKSVGYILDAKNDPVPLDVCLEDAATTPSVSSESRVKPKRDITEEILEEIRNTSKKMDDVIGHTKTSISYNENFNAISTAEDLKLKVSKTKMESSLKKRRLNI